MIGPIGRQRLLLKAFLGAILLQCYVSAVLARTIPVSPGNNQISGALKSITEGDELVLTGASYIESKSIKLPSFPVTIRAGTETRARVACIEDGTMLFTSHDLTLRGIHFDGNWQSKHAIIVHAPQPPTIVLDDCEFSRLKRGAIRTKAKSSLSTCLISRCVFHDINEIAVDFQENDGCEDLLRIENSTFYRVGLHAIVANKKKKPVKVILSNLTVYDCQAAIHLNDVDDGVIARSIIADNRVYAIDVEPATQISGLALFRNRGNSMNSPLPPDVHFSDPKFFSPEEGDFSLLPESPYLDIEGAPFGDQRWTGEATQRAALKRLEPRLRVGTAIVILLGLIGFSTYLWGRRREQAKAQAEIAKWEDRFQHIFEHSNDAIFTIRCEGGQILEANRRAATLLGCSKPQLIGTRISQHCSTVTEWQQLIEEVIRSGSAFLESQPITQVDDNTSIVDISAYKIHIEGLDCFIALVRDVTERENTRKQFVQVERLRALGEMSAGVSHNLNNILVSILGPAEVLRSVLGHQHQEDVQLIISSGLRAMKLVKRLHQSVNTGESPSLAPIDLEPVIRLVIDTSRPRWKDEAENKGIRIKIRTEIDAVPLVSATETELFDAVLNIVFNAIDAMPTGGDIVISTKTEGDHVRLTVQDNGIGMSRIVAKRALEPFFTTKANIGTGLGLATVGAAIKNWNARVKIDSEEGKGSAISLYLQPWRDSNPPNQADRRIAQPKTEDHRGCFLVVDDDQSVCHVLQQTLQAHQVQTETNGESAIANFEAGKFTAAFIDLGMPGIAGDRIAEALREKDPEIVLILITGWPSVDKGQQSRFDMCLQKPFKSPNEIVDAANQALELHRRPASQETKS